MGLRSRHCGVRSAGRAGCARATVLGTAPGDRCSAAQPSSALPASRPTTSELAGTKLERTRRARLAPSLAVQASCQRLQHRLCCRLVAPRRATREREANSAASRSAAGTRHQASKHRLCSCAASSVSCEALAAHARAQLNIGPVRAASMPSRRRCACRGWPAAAARFPSSTAKRGKVCHTLPADKAPRHRSTPSAVRSTGSCHRSAASKRTRCRATAAARPGRMGM